MICGHLEAQIDHCCISLFAFAMPDFRAPLANIFSSFVFWCSWHPSTLGIFEALVQRGDPLVAEQRKWGAFIKCPGSRAAAKQRQSRAEERTSFRITYSLSERACFRPRNFCALESKNCSALQAVFWSLALVIRGCSQCLQN